MAQKTAYTVSNIAGGPCYSGHDLDAAMRATTGTFAEPYVCCPTGRRPVYEAEDDHGEPYLVLGEYGQSYDDLAAAAR